MTVERFSIKNYMAMTAILLALVMTVLDVTVVNVALPVLAGDFGVSNSSTVWIVTAYQLVITMLLLPMSSIGDKFSYRRTFLTGMVLFTASSLFCALSVNFPMIVAARALQGIGASCVMGVNIALTRLIYPREVLSRGLALNAMVIAISTAAGPTIAGAILSLASWHWLFLINVPFGIAAFLIGRRLLPQNPPKRSDSRFDFVSAFENMAAFGLIFFAIGNFSHEGDIILNVALLCTGLCIGTLLIRRQRTIREPMLPVDLFRARLYSLSIITSVCSFIAQIVAMVSLPFLFLNSYGFSEIATGLLMTPWPVATAIVSPIAARIAEKRNPGFVAGIGMALFSAGIVLLLLLNSSPSEWDVAWRMAVCGTGFGLYQTPNNIVMVMATPIHRTGAAGGMQSTARLVGQTLGSTLVTLFFALFAGHSPVMFCLILSGCASLVASLLSFSRVSEIRRV